MFQGAHLKRSTHNTFSQSSLPSLSWQCLTRPSALWWNSFRDGLPWRCKGRSYSKISCGKANNLETYRPRVSRKNQTLADFPKIVEYWHPTKNGGYRPEDFKATKPMELWLQCQGCVHGCGRVHEWKASATNLVQYGGNIKCPYCNGRGGKTCHCNSVANSEFLMKGYHPENPPPEIVPQRTLARISWICPECNLSYVSSPRQRLFYGAMCPHCNKTKTKHPSIADGAPHLLEEWDYSKNTESPHNLRLGSNLKVWWVCKDCHHNWETQVHHRALRNYGCMKCREAYRFSQRPIIEN